MTNSGQLTELRWDFLDFCSVGVCDGFVYVIFSDPYGWELRSRHWILLLRVGRDVECDDQFGTIIQIVKGCLLTIFCWN